MSFHLTQVLAGHGCFGEYLCKIGKERIAACHHCEEEERNTAQHTLEFCSAWARERRVLQNIIREDLSLSAVVARMVESDENWKAVTSFCKSVMTQKEVAKRKREAVTGQRQRRYRR
ncbi:uncharacterized protein [Anoplolepis gracilipes]|uniref:uncharacterized protein n=1 Tax=Anoplolepis gracilipes TaxID=354296 RepID=UPI003BA0E7E0